MAHTAIPYIDPKVRHVGVSKLRELNASKLKQLGGDDEETLVIQDNDKPLAVLLSYEKYLVIQEQLASVMNTLELFSEEQELAGVTAGLKDISEGGTRSFAEIKAALRKKHGETAKQEK